MNRNEAIMTVRNMTAGFRDIYGGLISEIVLYGSYAKGTQTEESDVDIAVILNGKPSKPITDRMVEFVSLRELECGRVLSVIDINSEMFEKWKDVLPFYKNIRREGITLWKATA